MFAIFWNTIKDKKIAIIIYCIAAIAFLWMYVAMFPSIAEQSEDFTKAFENYPDAMFEAMGLESLSFDTIEDFVSMEHYSIMWPLMMMFFMVSLAGFSLAREVESGTIEIVLVRPISRLKIFFSRYLAGIFILVIFTSISVYIIAPLATLHKVDYTILNHHYIFALSLLFGWAVFSLSMMFSAIFSEKGKMYGAVSGILILMYALNVFASLKESLENLQYFSFFYYYGFNDALTKATIDNLAILIFAGVAIITTIIGAIYFNKRDVAV